MFTMLLAFCHVRMKAQTLTMQLPPAHSGIAVAQVQATAPASFLPSAPVPQNIPIAQPVPSASTEVPVTIHAREQEKRGDTYELRGEVEIHYKEYVVRADHITYNTETSQIVADGHLQLDGGPDHEQITASRGVMNLDAQTGSFYDVIGSVGVVRVGSRSLYTTPNPFLITGKKLVKSGPDRYEMLGGSMTSCRLPKPHWQILAPRILVDDGTAKAWNSNFRLLGYPILYLPYVTHAVDTSGRQSGFLLPELQTGSAIKGTVIGTAFYWAINRSADLTLGFQYYSLRGFQQSADFRYRGRGNDRIHGMYKGLEDRGITRLVTPMGQTAPVLQHVDQGGQDTILVARHDLSPYTRVVTSAEYLSSYTYRQVFAESFAQAVSSEVKSWGFFTREKNGLSTSFDLERYQNFASTISGDQTRILHLPTLEFNALDHGLDSSGILAGGDASFGLLSRSEPFYRSHNVGRSDLFPHLSLPWIADGWTIRPTIGLRVTLYSHSQTLGPVVPPPSAGPIPPGLPGRNTVPVAQDASLLRKALEVDVQILPPVLQRDFRGSFLARHFDVALRHTIEPEVNYRYVAGVNKFNNAPRFDPVDIYSDTDEVEYGVTQRLFLKRLHPAPCGETVAGAAPMKECGETSKERLSWFVGQKYFADPTFGGAVIRGRRNVLTTTLDFSGVAYLTAPRSLSPIVSRLRATTSANTDIEWDFDYDTKAGRVAATNVFANYRHGSFFSSLGHSLLNAVGETPLPPSQPQNMVNYNQMQLLLGYGALTKPGLSAAASGGLDFNRHSLEYAAVQATYNFDCCGFTVEYRKFQLGAIRNESQESFSFTLAGVGTAGNLKRAERLF
ncbi:MAG: LPS assembly protein LptD [Acidobacteriaceae bacterium]